MERIITFRTKLMGLLAVATLLAAIIWTQAAEKDAPKAKTKAKGKAKATKAEASAALPSPVGRQWVWAEADHQVDFPSYASDSKGAGWVAAIDHDGKADVLRLARREGDALKPVAVVSTPGVLHQPAVAVDGKGGVWCIWGQVDSRDVMTLRARRWENGKMEPEQTLASSAGSDTFAHAASDPSGRVWVAWQSMRRGQADVLVRWFDPQMNEWSKEFTASQPDGGNWEPRVVADKSGAWVVFDSSKGGEFNLHLARVTVKGAVKEHTIVSTPEYEARGDLALSPDGNRVWIAAERGRRQWGKDMRSHDGIDGLNGRKRLLVGYWDIAAEKFTELPVPEDGQPAPRNALSVNLPAPGCDAEGNLWVAWRYYFQTRWIVSVTRYVVATGKWDKPMEVPDSSLGQDRRMTWLRGKDSTMQLGWPSDLRENKAPRVSQTFLAELKADAFQPLSKQPTEIARSPEPEPYLNPPTAERPRTDHHTWMVGNKRYTLFWGDLHRHTDFSNCRTGQDGCVTEHFRYAYDMAALDFVGTSDHTDIAKPYHPYEWWQTQRLVDAFFTPGKFTSLYAYEREQTHPWGHRNVVFAQRGGPIVYINRQLYRASQWNELYPVKPGSQQITPMELWDVLRAYKQPVAVISHTGATGMGTDWDRYERIDNTLENTVEIFQGARVSYEGLGAPQPTVGLRRDEPYTPSAKAPQGFPRPPAAIVDFGKNYNTGVYQRALTNGFKLGVFASSDHVSTHTSFGGVYAEDFTRLGLIEGFRMRRSMAATDKIFVEFSCNGQPMGSVFEAKGKPKLEFYVNGTSTIKRVTVVRNEANYHVLEPGQREFKADWSDDKPLAGENRYYLRIEQDDGNMAWSSPVWVTAR